MAAAPKLNAGVDCCSAGFEAPVKLNADVAVPLAAPAAAPKIEDVVDGAACAAAPNEPNVAGLSAVAVDPKLGITLAPAVAAGWLLWPKTKLEPVLVGFGGSVVAGLEAAPKLKVGATVAVAAEEAAGAVVELLLGAAAAGVAVDEGATAAAGVDDELKLKPGVIDGPAGF